MGLQATIGDDLVAIIRAWIPKTKKIMKIRAIRRIRKRERARRIRQKTLLPFWKYCYMLLFGQLLLSHYLNIFKTHHPTILLVLLLAQLPPV